MAIAQPLQTRGHNMLRPHDASNLPCRRASIRVVLRCGSSARRSVQTHAMDGRDIFSLLRSKYRPKASGRVRSRLPLRAGAHAG